MGIRLQHQSRALTGLRLLSHELPAAVLALLPPKCAPRAVLQLDFKVHGFVYCEEVQKHADRSVSAICRTGRDREDLGPTSTVTFKISI